MDENLLVCGFQESNEVTENNHEGNIQEHMLNNIFCSKGHCIYPNL